jgi:hypothetical protein
MRKELQFRAKKRNDPVKDYGLKPTKGAGGTPLQLDDRYISKQYLKGKIDDRIKNDEFGVATWDGDTENTASREVLFNKINSMVAVSDVWVKEEESSSSNIRALKTGNYAIGPGNFASDSDWEKLYVSGNIKTTGNYIMQNNGSTIGPSSGELTLNSSNGAKLATKFAIGAANASMPLEVQLAATSTLNLNDGTGIAQFGVDGGGNLALDATSTQASIQARDGSGAANILNLNTTGGAAGRVNIGSTGSSTYVNGDLIVQGAATTLNTATLTVDDNSIVLNTSVTGTPPTNADAGIEVERGTSNNVGIRFHESTDKWQINSVDVTSDSDWKDMHADGASGIGTVNQLGTNTASALSLSTTTNTNDTINLADKFVQHAGDIMAENTTGKLVIGNAGDQTANRNKLTVYGGNSGSGPDANAVFVHGNIAGDTKTFNIEHPLDKNKRLIHGSLEGPEFGMYQRGTIKSMHLIEEIPLPEYWAAMVRDYSVYLTPHGNYNVWIVEKNKTMVKIKTSADAIDGPWKCDWMVIGSRIDHKLEVEVDAKE